MHFHPQLLNQIIGSILRNNIMSIEINEYRGSSR
jgi:hypothetical protein